MKKNKIPRGSGVSASLAAGSIADLIHHRASGSNADDNDAMRVSVTWESVGGPRGKHVAECAPADGEENVGDAPSRSRSGGAPLREISQRNVDPRVRRAAGFGFGFFERAAAA